MKQLQCKPNQWIPQHAGLLSPVTHRPPAQSKLDGVQIGDGTPHLSDQTFLGDVDVAEVEGVVDGLHFSHLDEPHSDGLGCSLQDPLPVILRLVQHLWRQTGTRAAVVSDTAV